MLGGAHLGFDDVDGEIFPVASRKASCALPHGFGARARVYRVPPCLTSHVASMPTEADSRDAVNYVELRSIFVRSSSHAAKHRTCRK